MKAKVNPKYVRSAAGSLLLIFLLTSILTGLFGSLAIGRDGDRLNFTTKTTSSTKQDCQLPYEEKEKEEGAESRSEDRTSNHFFLVAFVFDSISSITNISSVKFNSNSFHSFGDATRFPIYLSTLSLRI